MVCSVEICKSLNTGQSLSPCYSGYKIKMSSLHCPFDSILDIRQDTSAKGSAYMFYMSRNGDFEGKLIAAGCRIHGRKDETPSPKGLPHQDTFFIECRNSKHRKFGLIAAMIPKKPKIQPGQTFSSCTFVLVQGIHRCPKQNDWKIRFHKWNQKLTYKEFLCKESDLVEAIKDGFDIDQECPLNQINLIYLNTLLNSIRSDTNTLLLLPIEYSTGQSYQCVQGILWKGVSEALYCTQWKFSIPWTPEIKPVKWITVCCPSQISPSSIL